jgi:nucleotide-binding universal stress UspA family protein
LGVERVRWEVRVGKPAEQLAEAARAHNADLIAVGRHGERPGVWGHLGSTADKLVRAATTPVLLATGVRDVRPRRILVALDDSEATDVLVDWAHALAERFAARVTAVHVVGSAIMTHALAEPGATMAVGGGMPDDAAAHEGVRRDADRWVRSLVAGGVAEDRVSSEVAFGEPGQEILAAAERNGAELVVVGSHGAGRIRRMLVGSVASEVLRGARCPVLVVVPPTDEVVD